MIFAERLDTFIETSAGVEVLRYIKYYKCLEELSNSAMIAKKTGNNIIVHCKVAYFENMELINRIMYFRIEYISEIIYVKFKIEEHLNKIVLKILPDDEYIDFMKMTLG